MKTKLTQGSNFNKLRGLDFIPVSAKISEADWNFDPARVNETELVACCQWEYARESGSIRDRVRLYPDQNPFYQTPFPAPWQSLSLALRRKLSVQAAAQLCVVPFRTISAKVPWAGKQGRPERIKMPDGEERIVNRDGVEVLLAEIDWTSYTNGEIASCIRAWLDANRPSKIAEPTKRGHKPRDWRASLERLGIMRLIHHHTFDEMVNIVEQVDENAGENWKEFEARQKPIERDKFFVKSEAKKERRKVLDDFRTLFPNLPDEVPLSWKPQQGGW